MVYKIHLYKFNSGYKKSECGISFNELNDHTAEIEFVTCKKCKSK